MKIKVNNKIIKYIVYIFQYFQILLGKISKIKANSRIIKYINYIFYIFKFC